MKKKETRTLYLTMGLPGSGKTTWANKLCRSDSRNGLYQFDTEGITEVYKQKLFEQLRTPFRSDSRGSIIDSCIFNTDDILTFLSQIISSSFYDRIEIHYWAPDIESCLWNDRGRRRENSTITIKNAKVEYPDLKIIENYILENSTSITQCEIIEHKVERKPEWKVFADENDLYYDNRNYITSDSWSGGGTYQNCWGSGGDIEAEEPINFNEFDEIVEKFIPNISHKMYEEIWDSTINIEDSGESDYYGGYETKHYYSFNIPIFYRYLVDNKLIEKV